MLLNDNKLKVSPMLIWLSLAIFYFYQFIARSSFPTVLNENFMEYFRIDATGVGALASCYYIVYTIMQIPAGIISDKYSNRIVATAVTILCALGVFLFVYTSNYYIAGIGQMMIGFGSAFAFCLAIKSIVTWFPSEKVAIMTSCTMSVGGLGPVVGGPAISKIVKSFDWKNVMEIFSFVGLFVALLIWLTVKDKKRLQHEKSEDIPVLDSLKMVIASPQAWILALFTMMLYSPLSALGDLWGVSFIKKAYGVDATVAAFMNNMIYVGLVVGAPVFAGLSVVVDSYKKPMAVAITCAALLFGLILFAGVSVNVAFVLFLLLGFCCGAMLTYPLASTIFPISINATVTGFINMMSMVSGVILMPLIGYIIDFFWDGTMENGVKVYSIGDYRWALTSVLISLVIGIVLSLMMKDKSCKSAH